MNRNLKIANIVFCGDLGFKRKLKNDEINDLIRFCTNFWYTANEERNISIRRDFSKEFDSPKNGGTKKRNPHFALFVSGKIMVIGVKNCRKANRVYDESLADLKKFCPKVFKQNIKGKEKK